MKDLKAIIFIVIVLILTAISAYPQRLFAGKVVEILDGKTFVIEMQNGRMISQLQYIEVPEPDQPFFQTVKDHLGQLILDKVVEFQPNVLAGDKTIGRLTLKGVDISQQMLRDGAAWYALPEIKSHDAKFSQVYQENEAQAKAEKRGVWGIENLKPAWEFRAEKEEFRQQQENLARENTAKMAAAETKPQNKPVPPRKTTPKAEIWAEVGGESDLDQPLGVGGLFTDYDPAKRIGYIRTPSVLLDLPGDDFLQKVESRVFYIYKGDKTTIEDSVFYIGFLSISKDFRFLKSNDLTITADKQKIALGKALRFFRQNPSSVEELVAYKVTRAQLTKIINARMISLQLGTYSGGISNESLTYINNLLKVS